MRGPACRPWTESIKKVGLPSTTVPAGILHQFCPLIPFLGQYHRLWRDKPLLSNCDKASLDL